ncbi:MAG: ABC transporter ATP-binding protein [Acidobacteria bacterium]|nr:MAG: ABC transporter ATP-binding protein [Acidobacteriota bacterium]REK07354.1 MAG: ABC transporter ATP-binding protein [Acidobacteriota bacterium]
MTELTESKPTTGSAVSSSSSSHPGFRGELLLQLRGVDKYYESGFGRTYVLRRVDLDVRQGEFVTVMGPSGAGKSTLLHILGMLDSDFHGEYSFLGQRVDQLKPKLRSQLHKQHVGFVFQAYHLIDDLTVYENLEVPLTYRNIKRSEREALVCDVLDRFQMVGKRDLFPSQLSGGQQQLVGVARALIIEPKVILADEPTGNLHSSQGQEIMELFQSLNDDGTTIVQVTHSLENARYGHRIVELRDGWVHSDERVTERIRPRPGNGE